MKTRKSDACGNSSDDVRTLICQLAQNICRGFSFNGLSLDQKLNQTDVPGVQRTVVCRLQKQEKTQKVDVEPAACSLRAASMQSTAHQDESLFQEQEEVQLWEDYPQKSFQEFSGGLT